MAADPTLALQAAIVARLRGDADVGAVIGDRIYDRAPEAVAFPYASFGPVTAEASGGIAERGWDGSMQIDVWSRRAGRVEALQAMAAISAALYDAPLSVPGHHVCILHLELQTVVSDPDGATTHGVQRYRITTRET